MTTGIIYNVFKQHNNPDTDSYSEFSEDILLSSKIDKSVIKKKACIMVHVAGAVRLPGVYRIKKGLRVMDIIPVVGGLLPGADLDKVNLAAKIKDGQRVRIPLIRSKRKSAHKKTYKVPNDTQARNNIISRADVLVNLNSASRLELIKVPGIGPSTADRITDYRLKHGRFYLIEDLKKIRGIGEKKLAKIRRYIYI
ncbi:MAG: ComEA family DNA-binding protein [bacterium]|nr:ComEA family DNA-binding protein [bacterium]